MESDMETCVICDEKALKFKYSKYGITSCLSCRAFFRRAAANGCYKNFKCQVQDSDRKDTGPCNVAKSRRRRCAKCRFDKCIKGGMSHPSLKEEGVNEKVFSSLCKAEQMSPVSLYEVSKIFCQSSLENMMHIFSGAIHGNPLPLSSIQVLAMLLEEKTRKFSANLDGFLQVAPSEIDQAVLLERNTPAIICNRMLYFFQPDSCTFFEQIDKLNVFTFKFVPGDPGDSIRSISWEQIFKTNSFSCSQQEATINYVRTTVNALGLDQKIVYLLSAISLFDIDELDLSTTTVNVEKAREFQSVVIRLLMDYLVEKLGSDEAYRIHPQYLLILKDFKNVGNILRHQLQDVEETCPDINFDQASVLSDFPWSSFMT